MYDERNSMGSRGIDQWARMRSFLELCAGEIAGELSVDELAKVDARLAVCTEMSPC